MKSNAKTKKVVAKKTATTAKTTAKSASSKSTKSVKPVAKTASKPAVKKAVKAAAPVKSVKQTIKAAPKAAKKPVKAEKTVKQTIKASKVDAVKKAPAKAETKIVTAKPAVKAAEKQPVVVKMAGNQNVQVKSAIISSVRPQIAPQKQNTLAAVTATTRPVYRPIQVINKPLTPVQPVRQMAPVSKADEKVEFKKGDYVVYPAHGVGEIEAVETQTIGGMEIKLYAIVFEKDRMRLKVPVFKAHASGLRRLSSANRMQDALKTLQGRAQIRRAMWSRRAQEYETKINSGDPVSIAEVLRDLKRSNDDTEQSYSERQIYQSALERLAREVAAVDKISEIEAAERLENMIKGRRARAAASKDKEEAVA